MKTVDRDNAPKDRVDDKVTLIPNEIRYGDKEFEMLMLDGYS
jgi:hypothetical protein